MNGPTTGYAGANEGNVNGTNHILRCDCPQTGGRWPHPASQTDAYLWQWQVAAWRP